MIEVLGCEIIRCRIHSVALVTIKRFKVLWSDLNASTGVT